MVARTEFAIDLTVNPRTAEPGIRRIERRLNRTEKEAADLRQGITRAFSTNSRRLERSLSRVDQRLERSERRASRLGRTLRNTLGGLGIAIGGGALITGLVRTGDAFTTLQNRLRTVTEDQGELNQRFEQLSDIATRTRQRVGGVIQLYQRGSIAAKELGVSNQRLLSFVEKVGKGLAVQGGAAGTSAGALLQLSQALGAGTVRAEEFNSILEGAFPIAEAAARGITRFDGSVAKLRTAIIAGEVSSREFFEGILTGSDLIEERFSKTTGTVGEAVGLLSDRFTKFFGEFDKAAGITSRFSETIIGLSKNLEVVARVATDLALAFGVKLAATAIPRLISSLRALGTTTVLTDVSGGLGLATKETERFSKATLALNLKNLLINPFTLAIIAIEGARNAYSSFITVLEESESTLERIGNLAQLFGGIGVGAPSLEGISRPSGLIPARRPAAPTLAPPEILPEPEKQASAFRFLATAIEDAKQELGLFVREQERAGKVQETILRDLRDENELLRVQASNNEDLIRQKRIEIELRNAGAFATKAEIEEAIRLQEENEKLRAGLVRSTEFGEGVRQAFVELRREAEDLAAVGNEIVTAFADRATEAIVSFATTGKFSFQEFASAVLEDLIRIIARLLVVQALSAFVPGAGAGAGALGAATANIGRQGGGTVQPGQAVKVGEGGFEELFVPGRTGTVVPTGMMAAAAAEPPPPPQVTIINSQDPNQTAAELDSGDLDEPVLNVMSRNPARARQILGLE